MAELKPKQSKDDKAKSESAPPPADEVKGKEDTSTGGETAVVPVEVSSAKDGIQIKMEGDHVTLQLSQYIAEHIGQFRSCSHVVVSFKHGHAPDITAIHVQGQ